MILLSGQFAGNSYLQMLTVLVIFVGVLGVTAWTTKWVANYQKKQADQGNISLLDACRIGTNKYIQIVRVGEKYLALAICKDTVTVLCEIPEEQLKFMNADGNAAFSDVLKKIMKSKTNSSKESSSEENSSGENLLINSDDDHIDRDEGRKDV